MRCARPDRLAIVLALQLAACGPSTFKHELVDLVVDVQGPPAPGCPEACQLGGGTTLALAHASVTVARVELIACPVPVDRLRWLSPIRSAYAQTVHSTVLDAGEVIDLAGGTPTVALGTMDLSPPAASSFCEMFVFLGPALVDGARSDELMTLESKGTLWAVVKFTNPLVMDAKHPSAKLHLQIGGGNWLTKVDPDLPNLSKDDLLHPLADSLAVSP